MARRPKDSDSDGKVLYTVLSVDRAAAILKAFTIEKPQLTLQELSNRTGLHKVTAFRFLAALERTGFISKSPSSGKYSLGYAVINLAEVASKSQSPLREAALPVMHRLRDALGESVSLDVRAGDFHYRIERVEQLDHPVAPRLPLAIPLPLYAGTAGRALLASLPDDQLDEYLGRTKLEKVTPSTISDPVKLRADVKKIRRAGYAETFEGRASAVASVSAAIFDDSGRALGTLSVSVPAYRYTPMLRKRSIDAVLTGAGELSAGSQPTVIRGRRAG